MVEQGKKEGSKKGRNPPLSDHYSRDVMAPSKGNPWRREREGGLGDDGEGRGGVMGRARRFMTTLLSLW